MGATALDEGMALFESKKRLFIKVIRQCRCSYCAAQSKTIDRQNTNQLRLMAEKSRNHLSSEQPIKKQVEYIKSVGDLAQVDERLWYQVTGHAQNREKQQQAA